MRGDGHEERALTGKDDTQEPDDARAPRAEPPPRRPACPRCGFAHIQPFTHAGPGGRVNMKCIDRGELFRHPARR